MARPGGNPILKEKPFFTKENAREMQARGAEKQRENNAKRKALKESLDILLKKSLKRGDAISVEDIENIASTEKLNVSAQDAMAISLLKRAMMGDVQAFVAIRDTIGEKPTDKVEVDQSVTIESWAKSHKVKL